MIEHKVVDIRATGLVPSVVGEQVEAVLNELGPDGWRLQMIQPVIYNSATTGYLLLVLTRETPDD